MRVSKPLVYANIGALALNGVIIWMTIVKTFPVVVGILLVVGFFAGAVWFSCYMNGALPRQRGATFYASQTEKVETL